MLWIMYPHKARGDGARTHMRMDWPLPKRGKEPGTEANWFATSLGMVNVYLKLVVMNE